MNIRKLAQLAGVSVSTVSKIMNNKDESISAATRERVLRIAKEYHYQPYAAALSKDSKTWTLGVLLRNSSSVNLALTGMLEAAQQAGYTLMLRESGDDEAAEERNLSVLHSQRIDGLLWEPLGENSLCHLDALKEPHIPILLFNLDHPGAMNINYRAMAYQATQNWWIWAIGTSPVCSVRAPAPMHFWRVTGNVCSTTAFPCGRTLCFTASLTACCKRFPPTRSAALSTPITQPPPRCLTPSPFCTISFRTICPLSHCGTIPEVRCAIPRFPATPFPIANSVGFCVPA